MAIVMLPNSPSSEDHTDISPLLCWLQEFMQRTRPKPNKLPQMGDVNKFLNDSKNVILLTKHIKRLSNIDRFKLLRAYTFVSIQFTSLGNSILDYYYERLKEARRMKQSDKGIEE